jgi:hypothetical protein
MATKFGEDNAKSYLYGDGKMVLSLDEFLGRNGAGDASRPDMPELHRNPRNLSQKQREPAFKKLVDAQEKWSINKENLTKEYNALDARGVLRAKTQTEKVSSLQSVVAKGTGDVSESAKASARIAAKKLARMNAPKS